MTTTRQGQQSHCCDVACLQSSPSGQLFNKLIEKPSAYSASPTISIGLPVFNGENFIAEAIESILAQTFQDFELIISDNASTDRTREICRRYVRKDARVRYFRSPTNRGPAWNYNRVFELSQGTYFKWAAHDDRFEPTFLAATLAALVSHPGAVLSFSQVHIIDKSSQHTGPYEVDMALDAVRPEKRFQETISLKHRCYEIFGLMERSRLAQTPLIGPYAGSDRVLLSQLILQGTFVVVPEPLFQAREHSQQSIEMLRSPRKKHLRMHDYAVWFDPLNQGKVLFPNWRILKEYMAAVWCAPVTTRERISCGQVLLQWLFSYNNVGKLARDVAIAAAQIVAQFVTNLVSLLTAKRLRKPPENRTLENWNRTRSKPKGNPRSRFRSARYHPAMGAQPKARKEQEPHSP